MMEEVISSEISTLGNISELVLFAVCEYPVLLKKLFSAVPSAATPGSMSQACFRDTCAAQNPLQTAQGVHRSSSDSEESDSSKTQ